MNNTAGGSILSRDRRYVYLIGSAMAALTIALIGGETNAYSFIGEQGFMYYALWAAAGLFLAVSAVALAVWLTHKRSFRGTAFEGAAIRRAARYGSYIQAAALLLAVIDRVILKIAAIVVQSTALDKNPAEFFPSMVYMTVKGHNIILTGIWTTVRIALLGTLIAFVLSMLMVFCRIQTPNKRDNDLVKALKWLASHFAQFYIFVIRGTPMMVQALIFYYFGFNLFKRSGMTVTEINNVWSFFISGLCTVSLNSTAYLAEVLRGGIQAIDPGQMEAARSLGMTNWQAMIKVVFPQAVKNSIPAIGNEFIINIKDSAVLSVIGVMDLMYSIKSVAGIYYRSLEIYCVGAVLYLILTWLSSCLLKFLAKKLDTSFKGIPSSN